MAKDQPLNSQNNMPQLSSQSWLSEFSS